MKRNAGIVLVVLGLAAALLGILSATVWRASNVVTMAAPRPESPVVVTDPGVLGLMDGEVSLTAEADADQPITLVLGRTEQVDAWVAGSPHQRVTGAAAWDALAAEEVPLADGGTETVPSPMDADGWLSAETGEGSLETTWQPEDGRWSVLAVTDGTAPAPALTLSWQREVTTPWLWPGVIGGALLALAGAVLLALGVRESRAAKSSRAAVDRGAETTTMPAVGRTGRGSSSARGSSTAAKLKGSATKKDAATPTAADGESAPSRRARREKEGR